MTGSLNLPVAPNFTRTQVASACRKWAIHLFIPKGSSLDGAKLLWALSGNESSFGANCQPRHEAIYCTGKYSTNPEIEFLTKEFEHGAHCSYGPWQLMLANCPMNVAPKDLFDIENALIYTIGFINTRIFKHEGATTLNEIADAYNSGDWRDRLVPEKYILDCTLNYNVPMPV